MRNYALFAALALALGSGAALADHAIEPNESVDGNHAIETNQAIETKQPIEADQAVEAHQAVAAEEPNEENVVYGITREVCTVSDWGLGEVRRECLTEVLPPREPNPALEGICMIKYGVRTCY